MKSLFIILSVLFLISCDSGTTTGNTTSPFIGTWNYSDFEIKQDVTTNSDQTTIPVMGTMAGIIPLNNGLVIQGDGNNDTLNYMSMFMGVLNMDFMTLRELMESEGEPYEDYEDEADYPECIASCPGVDDINPDMPTEFCTWVTVTAESTCFAGCTG